MKYGKIIPIVLIAIIILFLRSACSSEPKDIKPLTKEQVEQNKKDSLKTVREDKLDNALTVLKMQLKDNMKDPSSFEMVTRAWNPEDSLKDIVRLQIQFRGNNSFGGKTVSVCEGTYDFKTDQVKIKDVFQR